MTIAMRWCCMISVWLAVWNFQQLPQWHPGQMSGVMPACHSFLQACSPTFLTTLALRRRVLLPSPWMDLHGRGTAWLKSTTPQHFNNQWCIYRFLASWCCILRALFLGDGLCTGTWWCEWVYLEGEIGMAASGLGCGKPLLGAGQTISLVLSQNDFEKSSHL